MSADKSIYIDKLSRKEKKEILKSKINEASDEELDAFLLDFGYDYSEDEEGEEW